MYKEEKNIHPLTKYVSLRKLKKSRRKLQQEQFNEWPLVFFSKEKMIAPINMQSINEIMF